MNEYRYERGQAWYDLRDYAAHLRRQQEETRQRQEEIASSPIAREAYKGKVIEHEPSASGASRRD